MPSVDVKVPRLAAAPFALECKRSVALAFGPGRELLVGEVLRIHAREGLLDADNMYVDLAAYRPIGRLFGNLYTYQREPFTMDRESHAQWSARVLGGKGGRARPRRASARESCTAPSAMVGGGLRRVDHGNAERVFEAGGAGAPCRHSP